VKILEVQNLRVGFPVVGGVLARKIAEVRAVDDVSFSLEKGETLGLVGESGCGKSTVGRAIVNILRAMVYGVEISGSVFYYPHASGNGDNLPPKPPSPGPSAANPPATLGNGKSAESPVRGASEDKVDLLKLNRDGMRPYRSDIQMIFQDPYSSLNPRMTVGQIVEEPLTIHTKEPAQQRKERVGWLLSKVGFTKEQANRYPHEFSGGQRQRIGIARALATNPKIVIADEPVSALDVSIQAQVVNLMQDLQEEFGLSYIFIAHDLSVVRHISNRIVVMYLGNIMEVGPAERIYNHPMHPYSRALLSAVPRADPDMKREDRIRLTGDVPNPIHKPSGCAFHTRCPIAKPTCADAVPPLEWKDERWVACPWV
jgi:oligopeptide transport system ATP-binding protein